MGIEDLARYYRLYGLHALRDGGLVVEVWSEKEKQVVEDAIRKLPSMRENFSVELML